MNYNYIAKFIIYNFCTCIAVSFILIYDDILPNHIAISLCMNSIIFVWWVDKKGATTIDIIVIVSSRYSYRTVVG